MKLFRMLGRSFRDATKSLARNISLSLASIVSIAITLTIMGAFLVISLNVENFTKSIKGDVSIVVFLDNDVTDKRVREIGNQIEVMANVKSVSLETKESVKNKLRQESEVFDSIMSTWSETDNPLSDTYNVKVDKVENISATANKIQSIEGVKLVEYGANFVSDLLSMFNSIERIGIIAIVCLMIVTAFLIMNTIKLTIIARKNEINIMRLVGASNAAIKIPFIVEGLFLGVLGAILPILLVIYGYSNLYMQQDGTLFTPIIKLVQPEPFIYKISLLLLMMGIIVGMFSSSRAVKRYLKI